MRVSMSVSVSIDCLDRLPATIFLFAPPLRCTSRAERFHGAPLEPLRAIALEDYDKVAGDRGEAAASVEALRAAVQQARLDLGYTKVIAPVSPFAPDV